MRIALTESINKWIEYYVRIAEQQRLLPRNVHLVFDDYDKSDVYPKLKVEIKDLDILDTIWRAQSTVVVQVWVNGENNQQIRQFSNFTLWLVKNFGSSIPVFDFTTALWDRSDSDEWKDKELGEKILAISPSQKSTLHFPPPLERERIPAPFSPIVYDNSHDVVLYLFNPTSDVVEKEYEEGIDYTFNPLTGTINWTSLTTLSLQQLQQRGREIRCYYTYRSFSRYVKILEGSVLEVPFNQPDRSNPGILRFDFSFDVLY